MASLQEQFLSVAKEYARQFGQIIGTDFEFWTGVSDGHAAMFGDSLSFTLEEMAIVVDRLERWVEIYGSVKAVGQEVLDWHNSIVSDCATHDQYIATYKRINLYTWLNVFKPQKQNT